MVKWESVVVAIKREKKKRLIDILLVMLVLEGADFEIHTLLQKSVRLTFAEISISNSSLKPTTSAFRNF